MKITLSQYAGFCEGVERAYEIIKKASKDKKVKKPIFVFGSLVHNQDVVDRIEKLGVRKISLTEDLNELLDSIKKEVGTLVITAHGMGPEIYELTKKKKISVIDTTCPRVMKAQRLAKIFADRKAQIIIIGDKKHKETKGINEWTNSQAILIENKKDLKTLKLNLKKKISIISQTTQDQDFTEYVNNFVKKQYPSAEIMDTICSTTHNRQTELKNMAKSNDVIIAIGSPESANSTRLWEIAKRINPKAYFIERASQIKKEWLRNCQTVGITAGASTPGWIIDEIMENLKNL
ncbi:MAG: 4-hydroxy-3-methylbut-2-enyl diphosphate reductase [Candidatus Moranbacteria bacterium CG10_big_fil_rev_8_21_14_0_10_35_21]|nr:MAG: 4-hydroxy-3-methylbut-2-enyl diphosphate reductase [Candidatus Moranbacteria bacterium CG10_big_fil_rev_8_21_14_0_10_35_21]PJA88627.1 MAG: 4-hydroxy-3-methylbut-2-enyl diphosphate reductase [Candidatus Moranbacteria bacterium CG_4_9_14_3_um_filter_36_9]